MADEGCTNTRLGLLRMNARSAQKHFDQLTALFSGRFQIWYMPILTDVNADEATRVLFSLSGFEPSVPFFMPIR